VRVTTAFNRILGLDGASVRDVSFAGDEVVVEIALRRRRLVCGCGFSTRATYDRSRRRWRHLDMCATKVWLEADIRRLDCPDCGVRTETVPWARPRARLTRDFEDQVAWLTQRSDKTTVSKLMRCSWETVNAIVGRVVAEQLVDSRLDGLVHVGVDEISYKSGHHYLTVVVDHDTGRVVWAVEGRTKQALTDFFAALGERKHQIRAVSMDMTPIYRGAAQQAVPQAVICLDPFHAMQWMNEALDRVYAATPRNAWEDSLNGLDWRRTRTALRTAKEGLKDHQHQHVQQLRRRRYQLWRAWELKEQFRDLYRTVKPADAHHYLKTWCTAALRSRIPSFKLLVKRIRRNFDGIVAAVQWGLSNSRVEGVNGKIRLINNRAHGHKSVASLTAMIHLCLGGINIKLPTQT
jgi:transposase